MDPFVRGKFFWNRVYNRWYEYVAEYVCSTLGELVSRAGSKRDFHPATFSPYTSFFVYHLCFNFFPRNGVIRRCIPDVTVKRRDSDMVWRTDGYSCYGCKNGIATQIFYFVPLKTWNEDSYKFKIEKKEFLSKKSHDTIFESEIYFNILPNF